MRIVQNGKVALEDRVFSVNIYQLMKTILLDQEHGIIKCEPYYK